MQHPNPSPCNLSTSRAARLERLLFRLLLYLSLIAIVVIDICTVLSAHADHLELNILPTRITIPSGTEDTRRVLIVARNPERVLATGASLNVIHDDSVTVKIHSLSASIPAAGDLTWLPKIENIVDRPRELQIIFTLEYFLHDNDDSPQAPFFAAGMLDIIVITLPSPAASANARLILGFDTIREPQTGRIYLLVENSSTELFTVTGIDAQLPRFMYLDPVQLNKVVGPGETTMIPLELRLGDSVAPGIHSIVLGVNIGRYNSDTAIEGNVFVYENIRVGVPGLSEIQEVIQIPSFLFLPGILTLLTYALLQKLVMSTPSQQEFLFSIKEPYFWIAAITISGVAAIIYPIATDWVIGQRRNYLESYGLSDLVYVWLGSVLIVAPIAYFVPLIGAKISGIITQKATAWAHERRVPSSSDTPISLLLKLERANCSFYVEQLDLNADQKTQRVCRIPINSSCGGKVWVAPRAVVRSGRRDTPLAYELKVALGDYDHPGKLADILSRRRAMLELKLGMVPFRLGGRESLFETVWERGDVLSCPTLVDEHAFGRSYGRIGLFYAKGGP